MAKSVNRSEASKEKARVRIREYQRRKRKEGGAELRAKEAAYAKARRAADPERARKISNACKSKARIERPHLLKNQWFKWKYGITLEQFNEMLLTQEGKCAFCGVEHTEEKPLCVDHDHAKPKGAGVRWLLCRKCNTMIGVADERPEVLRKAADLLGAYYGAGDSL